MVASFSVHREEAKREFLNVNFPTGCSSASKPRCSGQTSELSQGNKVQAGRLLGRLAWP